MVSTEFTNETPVPGLLGPTCSDKFSVLPHPRVSSGETVTVFLPRTALRTGGLAVVAALALGACGAAPDDKATTADGKSAATATSAADFGGMDALVAAAKKEGTLNAIALPPRLGQLRRPDRRLHQEVRHQDRRREPRRLQPGRDQRVTSRKGQDRAPDVVDLGSSFALSAARQGLLAPYKVAAFDDIPDGAEGRRRPLVQRLRRLHLHRLRRQEASRSARRPSRTCSSRSTRARSRSTATPPSRVRRSAASTRPRWPAAARFDDIQPGLDFFPS